MPVTLLLSSLVASGDQHELSARAPLLVLLQKGAQSGQDCAWSCIRNIKESRYLSALFMLKAVHAATLLTALGNHTL